MVNLDELSVEHLALAYRKAKVDLYYSNDARATDLVEYEAELESNLERLLEKITKSLKTGEFEWVETAEFVGGHSLIAKGLTPGDRPKGHEERIKSGRLEDFHLERTTSPSVDGTATFRVLSRCSIDMHVLGALWLGTVGAKMETVLGIAPVAEKESITNIDGLTSSFGDRLRRSGSGAYNWFSPGSFRPYLHQYRKWQDQGFRAIEAALDRDEPVVVVTADFTAFFPTVEAGYLLQTEFLDTECKEPFSTAELMLTKMLVAAIHSWGAMTHRKLKRQYRPKATIPVGLPIGFPASALIANMALARFDRAVRNQLNPLYYGRYVDDLTIVIRRSADMTTGSEVWDWISKRIALVAGESLTVPEADASKAEKITYSSKMLDAALKECPQGPKALMLSPQKTQCYFLAGTRGRLLLESIQEAIQNRTSEWRALPDIPRTPREVPHSLIAAVGEDGTAAESLRLVHALTTNRAHFALRLRDFEALAKDLPNSAWVEHRTAFFKTAADHFCSPLRVLDFAKYVPRLIQLSVMTCDWEGLKAQLLALVSAFLELKKSTEIRVEINGTKLSRSSAKVALARWFEEFQEILIDAVTRSLRKEMPAPIIDDLRIAIEAVLPESRLMLGLQQPPCSYDALFAADLAAVPFRSVLLPHEWRQHPVPAWWKSLPGISLPELPELLDKGLEKTATFVVEGVVSESPDFFTALENRGVESFAGDPAQVLNQVSGYRYPTRPLGAGELSHLTRVASQIPQPHLANEDLKDLLDRFCNGVLALRGYSVDVPEVSELEKVKREGRGVPIIKVPKSRDRDLSGTVRVALAAIKTDREQLAAAIHRAPDLSLKRYRTLSNLIRGVINGEERADILMCPELSIPREWYSRIAFKLQSVGTSLIAGVEYEPSSPRPRQVSNQVWANFAHDAWGFPSSYVYVQDKQRPSRGEELNLLSENQVVLNPRGEWNLPPIINMQGVYLAILVCSELTNLEYRSYLRSNVDLLFVPEWNQDVKTFASIVEASAFDMHLFVAQANNRIHGDTRVRGPYRKEWRRDIVKVSGGSHDYVLVGEVEISKLRRFQSSHDVPDGEFKTLPDGFEMPPHRDHWHNKDNV